MNAHEYLGDDGQAMLLLCSSLAVPATAKETVLSQLKLSEWNQLERKIRESSLRSPAALLGRTAEELAKALALPTDEAERIARLLEFAGQLSAELQNLFEHGLWAVTRADELYPAHLRDTLKHQAPTVLFGAGNIHLLQRAGVAVVGSRNIDEAGAAFAREVGTKAVSAKLPVVSGGARGTDRIAMQAALEAGGIAFGALADSLERTTRQADVREFVNDGKLVLLTPYAPTAGFSVGAAMGRNKLIYGLAEFAVVVSSDHQSGGTWAGAVEALKANWCPVLVRDGDAVPRGNKELLKVGATALPTVELAEISDLSAWMTRHTATKPVEADLFDLALRERPK
ncbi:MAG: DNA-processing protein DprA [Verrucomicrobia bacterium]|jgi:predicted Rossmann fold nucleotide-binding protein DprA/Smf involved in DNA uptake|nr:DNA-processing protein DprA [Verrucomicrobiota bacterium]